MIVLILVCTCLLLRWNYLRVTTTTSRLRLHHCLPLTNTIHLRLNLLLNLVLLSWVEATFSGLVWTSRQLYKAVSISLLARPHTHLKFCCYRLFTRISIIVTLNRSLNLSLWLVHRVSLDAKGQVGLMLWHLSLMWHLYKSTLSLLVRTGLLLGWIVDWSWRIRIFVRVHLHELLRRASRAIGSHFTTFLIVGASVVLALKE